MAMEGREIVVTPLEAVAELTRLMKTHQMKRVLSDPKELAETIKRMAAVISMYEAMKPKEKKKR
jgi:hypothetical protein